MRTLVVYYSYSGNTHKVAGILEEMLRGKGEVVRERLQPQDESKNFFMQGRRAFKKVRAVLAPAQTDAGAFDLVCIGTPIWAFGPVPAVNTYLDQAGGLAGKKVLLFSTSGGGGIAKTFEYMKKCLEPKGCEFLGEVPIHQSKVGDRDFVVKEFEKVLLRLA